MNRLVLCCVLASLVGIAPGRFAVAAEPFGPPSPTERRNPQNVYEVRVNGYWIDPKVYGVHPSALPAQKGKGGERIAWIVQLTEPAKREDALRKLGLSLVVGLDERTFIEYCSVDVMRKAGAHPRVRAVMHLPPELKIPPGVNRETAYLGEPFDAHLLHGADSDGLKRLLGDRSWFSRANLEVRDTTGSYARVWAKNFDAVGRLAERSDVYFVDVRRKKVLSPDAKGPGETCSTDEDCQSGLCEGPGCGPAEGRCARLSWRICTNDVVTFCGCDGQSFTGSSGCPGARYRARGRCEDAPAMPPP